MREGGGGGGKYGDCDSVDSMSGDGVLVLIDRSAIDGSVRDDTEDSVLRVSVLIDVMSDDVVP